IWKGLFLGRQNQMREARRTLSESYHLAIEHDAIRIANSAHCYLKLAGGRIRQGRRPPGVLTQRQDEVANLAARGMTDSEIANELGISAKTVGHHLEAVYEQLRVSRRDLIGGRRKQRSHHNGDFSVPGAPGAGSRS
ncbi:MAG: helix-turn-helix transcriptional regulator, partial [Acidimicrobiales bacterium]